MRPYQREAMQALDHAVELGKRRFLIELPTGTGKTDLVCLYLKRLIQAGRAERILFLVDREQLAKQALEAIQDILNQYSSYWLRPGTVRQEQQITVCLLQTMIGRYPISPAAISMWSLPTNAIVPFMAPGRPPSPISMHCILD